jgi:hypothetical protein
VLGALLLAVSDFTTLWEVKVITVVKDTQKGHEQHSYGLVLLALVALPMVLGAARGLSRPAMVATAALGVVALVIALAFDLPDATANGVLADFSDANASPQIGFYLETLGAVLLLLCGVGHLVLGADSASNTGHQVGGDRAREPHRPA